MKFSSAGYLDFVLNNSNQRKLATGGKYYYTVDLLLDWF